MAKGTYLLLVKIDEKNLSVGSLGTISFKPGWYAYVGSAFGPGGLKRIQRHKRVAKQGDVKHWHIDYILPEAIMMDEKTYPGKDIECELPKEIDGMPIRGFGCSDCDCDSHLYYVGKTKRIDVG